MSTEQIDRAINAWHLCDESANWSQVVDIVRYAEWQGQTIAWLGHEGESFEIFRLDDSRVITDHDLPIAQALSLEWQQFKPATPIFLAHGRN